MANPQLENGYTSIANEILEALAGIRLPGEVMQVVFTILRKTYGYHKKEDSISLSQFVLSTKINRPNLCRALNKAIKMNIIIKKDNGIVKKYRFNKDFESWVPLSKKITIIKKDNESLSKKIHTKETIQKKDTPASQVLSDKSKSMKTYNEMNHSDSDIPTVDNDTGEIPAVAKVNKLASYKKAIDWLENRTGKKLVNLPKQYKALKDMAADGIAVEDIKEKVIEMQSGFFKDKPFDFATVRSQIKWTTQKTG